MYDVCARVEKKKQESNVAHSIWSETNRESLEVASLVAYVMLISLQRLFAVMNGNIG